MFRVCVFLAFRFFNNCRNVLIECFVVGKFSAAVYKISVVVCYRKTAIDPVV